MRNKKPVKLKKTKKLLSPKQIEQVFERLAEHWPNAKCELVHNTPFQLLVAVVLSAQATDKSVNKALQPLLKKHPDFDAQDLVHMGESKFLSIIRSIGLAPTKAKNCLGLSRVLAEKYSGQVPRNREQLEALPGVGRKTANVVLNVLYGEPTMPVDTHVARLAVRMGLVEPTNDRNKIEAQLLRKVPEKFNVTAHHLLIFHGRYLCLARTPKCEICPLLDLCPKVGVSEG